MLRSRIIPSLLVRNGGLVKTRCFGDDKYVGDPINAVRIFNEKEVDELIVLDIDATRHEREPSYTLIANLAAECRMPLAYGGGVNSADQVERIVSLGVEKVCLSSAAIANPQLVSEAATRVGSQSVVVVLDVKRTNTGEFRVFTHNGKRDSHQNLLTLAKNVQEFGAGEIVLNSIDRDGGMMGYDMDLVALLREATRLPLTVLGGAGSIAHMGDLIKRFGVIGAAAGSLFVFKGKYRAVLINYPGREEKDRLCEEAWQGK